MTVKLRQISRGQQFESAPRRFFFPFFLTKRFINSLGFLSVKWLRSSVWWSARLINQIQRSSGPEFKLLKRLDAFGIESLRGAIFLIIKWK